MRAGPALLLLAALAGCTGPQQGCALIGVDTAVRVDTTALDLPADATGRVCLDQECTDADPGDPLFPEGVRWTRDIPDVPTVQVRLTLHDGTGTELWSAGTSVDTEVIEPNGPGCGRTTVLPELRATPDGRLTTP